MKTTRLFAVLILLTGILEAATPQEESRFLTAVREAFTRKDARAVVSLSCFDNIPDPELQKACLSTNIQFLNYKIASVQYLSPDPTPSTTTTSDGKLYKWNLPLTKQIKILYITGPAFSTQTLNVGEKNGTLFLIGRVQSQATNSTSHP